MGIRIFLIPIAAILGGLGRRTAGGMANQIAQAAGWIGSDSRVMGDTPARLIFGATIAASAYLGGAVWWHALAVVPGIWAGTTISNFGSISQGRGGGSPWSQALGNLAHGLAGVALPTVGAWWLGYGWPWMLAGGLLCPVAYWLGWTICRRWGRQGFPVGFRGGSEMGEFLYGAAIGVGAYLAAGSMG